MKRIALTLCAALAVTIALAQPNTKLRPNETVLLYGTELIDNVDPVVGKTVSSAGFEMPESYELAGPEEIDDFGNLHNTNVNARVDL